MYDKYTYTYIYIYNDLFKITNISLLFRRFINAINVINVLYIYIYIYIYKYNTHRYEYNI